MKAHVKVKAEKGGTVSVVTGGAPGDRWVFLEVGTPIASRSLFLSPKELDRLMSALQRAVVEIRRKP